MKTRRTDYLAGLKQPGGLEEGLRQNLRRTLNLERAPIHINIPTTPAPQKRALKKAATPPPAALAPLYVALNGDTVELYDPDADSWTPVAGSAPVMTLGPLMTSFDGLNLFYWTTDEFDLTEHIARSFDGGDTWDTVEGPNSGSIRCFTVGPDDRFWVVSNGTGTANDGIWVSDDFGDTWTLAKQHNMGGIVNAVGAWFDVKADDADRIAIGIGSNTGPDVSGTETRVLVSIDGGATWNEYAVYAHHFEADGFQPVIKWLPSGRLVITLGRSSNDGGSGDFHVFYSDDDGATWTEGSGIASGYPSDVAVIGSSLFILTANATTDVVAVLRGDGATFTELDGIPDMAQGSLGVRGTTLYLLPTNVSIANEGVFEGMANARTSWNPQALTGPGPGYLSHTYDLP